MTGKIRAAVDARHSAETLKVARTDAIAVEGFEAAMERAAAYAEAGADMLFVEAPKDREQLRRIAASAPHGKPMMANMVEGGQTPVVPAHELGEIGYSLVIFPAAIVRAIARTAREFFTSLKESGTSDHFLDRMLDFDGLNGVTGTKGILQQGAKYEDPSRSS